MRQLKTLMRNIKKDMLACGDCQCRTLQCWRHGDGNCGCDGGGGGHRVTVIWDEDYNGRNWTVGETYTLGFTISPSDTPIQFSSSSGYVQVPSWDTSGGHHNIQMDVIGTYDPQGIGGDTLYVSDGNTGEPYSSIDLVTIRYADSINVETTEVETQAYGMSGIPFTYSPSNGYPINMMAYAIDDNNIVQNMWVSNWDNGHGTINVATQEPGTTQVHISSTNHPEDVYTIDVTVHPRVSEISINTDPITIDLDNDNTYTIPFTYTPSDGYFDGLYTQSNYEGIAFTELEKTNDGEGNLNIFGRAVGQTSVALITPDEVSYGIAVTTTSIHPNIDNFNDISFNEIYMCGTGSSAERTFNYSPTDALLSSAWVTVENESVINTSIVKDADGRGHVQIDSLVNEGASWVYLNFTDNNGSSYTLSTHCTIIPPVESISLNNTSDCVMNMGESQSREFGVSPGQAIPPCFEAYSDDESIATVDISNSSYGRFFLNIYGQWTPGYTQVHLGNDDIGWIDINVYISCITNIDDSGVGDVTVAEGDIDTSNLFTYTPTDASISSLYVTIQDDTICEAWVSGTGNPGDGGIVVQGITEGQTTVTYGNDVVGYNSFNVTVTAPL